jgi:hypothetical protein
MTIKQLSDWLNEQLSINPRTGSMDIELRVGSTRYPIRDIVVGPEQLYLVGDIPRGTKARDQ